MNKSVVTNKGTVEGIEKGGYVVFKGIPYAKAPVGELRWKAPQELDAWEGTYKADTFQNMCMQEYRKQSIHLWDVFIRNFIIIQNLFREWEKTVCI